MKWKTCAIPSLIVLLIVLAILLTGCEAPVCYPPNKIIGNKCCIDDNDNGACDIEEAQEAPEESKEQAVKEKEPVPEATEEDAPEKTEKEEAPKENIELEQETEPEATGLEPGKYKIKIGEPKKYLEINELTAYRTSRNKGMLDEMTFTVRNIGSKTLNPVVELLFDGSGMSYIEEERVPEYDLRVGKEYMLDPIEPGEKLIVKKSLGIRFQGIDNKKKLSLTVYERYSAPREDLEIIKKEFVPQDLFESMEIYTYGLPEE